MKYRQGSLIAVTAILVILAMATMPFLYAAGEKTEQLAKIERISLEVRGMKNAFDPVKIREALRKKVGVLSTECDHVAGRCRVEIDSVKVKKEEIVTSINRLGFRASLGTGEAR